ncbi:MAG: NYN domain-containing protein [candidate division Zixibacteria bacterium]|nr:NYN domain-containing protein [Candidatus Tariuqbacter arcticus]
MAKHRANVYFDGFNFYHGICQTKRKELLWIDLVSLIKKQIGRREQLYKIKYFTTPPLGDESKIARHEIWEKVLESLSHPIEIYRGRFNKETIVCKKCKRTFSKNREKWTDISIATHLIFDSFLDDYEIAYIVSGDSDYMPAITMIKEQFPEKKIKMLFPPKRAHWDYKPIVDYTKCLTLNDLYLHILPDHFICPDGTIIHKPKNWRKLT